MLEYLYLICLLCLTISVPILIRGCFQIHRELPTQGGTISDKIDDVSGVLNELADFIADLSNGIGASPVNTNPPTIVETLLTAFLKPNTPSGLEHGKTQQTERSFYEIIEPQTKQTEDEHNELSS